MSRPTIRIEYCTSCNYLPRALWIAAELLPDMQYDLEALLLVPGDRGVFDLRLDEQLLFSKVATGRFPDPDELKQSIFDAMEARRGSESPA